MSWSVFAIGKAPAVRASIAEQFTRYKCSEPEETVKKAVAASIDAALEAQDPATVVKVAASGSQNFKNYETKSGVSNQCTISIDPMHGFVE